jgi:hypothetical protein
MGRVADFLTAGYVRAFGMGARSYCRTLRALAGNASLSPGCIEAVAVKINTLSIAPHDFFRFNYDMICLAAQKAEPAALVDLASRIDKSFPLSLWPDKNCYFEPLYVGEVRLLVLFFALPESGRKEFLDRVEEKQPELVKTVRKTLQENLLFTAWL